MRPAPSLQLCLVLLPLLTSTFLLLPITACPVDLSTSLTSSPTPSNTFTPSTPVIRVPPSSSFFLRLKANPTTGYSWALHPSSAIVVASSLPSSSPPPLCAVDACQYAVHEHGPGMVGVGGDELWELRSGEAEGEAVLALQYRRPWMGDLEQPSIRWTVQVEREATQSEVKH